MSKFFENVFIAKVFILVCDWWSWFLFESFTRTQDDTVCKVIALVNAINRFDYLQFYLSK